MNTKTRTDSYIFTADPLSGEDMRMIDVVRKTVKTTNLFSEKKYRVCLKARLGKNNPAYASYKHQWIKSIKLEDAQRIDVYVQRRVSEWTTKK